MYSKSSKFTSLLGALVMLAMLVTACGPAPAPTPTKPAAVEPTVATATSVPKKPSMVIVAEGAPPSFDPIGATDDSRVDAPSIALYNTLVQVKS